MARSDTRAAPSRSARWSLVALVLGPYPNRMMAALAVSLLVVTLVVRLPIGQRLTPVGWHPSGQYPLFDLVDVDRDQAERDEAGAPITLFGEQEDVEEGEDELTAKEEAALPAPAAPAGRMASREAVLDFSEKMPSIEGGMGALYIHIEYPQAAIEAGIEGRLMLSFVVERDGHPTDIRVMKSLHPLCDSSAVRALRQTRFVPGRQNGETVRVRMRLPVHFKLIDTAAVRDT